MARVFQAYRISMSLIAEFTIETPILQRALQPVPEMVVEIQAIRRCSPSTAKAMMWVWGDDFHRFERALDTDPMVGEYKRLSDVEQRCLYRITHTEGVEKDLAYPLDEEYDIVITESIGTHQGVDLRARFPDRDMLLAYRNSCEERDIPFRLQKLSQAETVAESGLPSDLTRLQRETLSLALEAGYFEIPRRTTLSELADELGISDQAVSARLRRGQRKVFQDLLDCPR